MSHIHTCIHTYTAKEPKAAKATKSTLAIQAAPDGVAVSKPRKPRAPKGAVVEAVAQAEIEAGSTSGVVLQDVKVSQEDIEPTEYMSSGESSERDAVAELIEETGATSDARQAALLAFDPAKNCGWLAGESVPFAHVAETLDKIEKTSKRLEIVDELTNALRYAFFSVFFGGGVLFCVMRKC